MAKRVITISREFGSGGRFIGKQVAEALGIPFYDRELLALVAKESGFDLDFIEETGEYSASGSLLYGLSMASFYPLQSVYNDSTMPLSEKIHVFQSKIIKDIAAKGSCVIVGRCADYILKERSDCLNVLIHADIEEKRKRAVEYLNVDAKYIDKELKKKDKARASHYSRYTGMEWGNVKNYHLSINSGAFGIDGSVEIIRRAYEL